MIRLFGDSILRGLALGRFPEVYTPEEAAAEPLWALRSPASMMNLMLGEELVELAGITGLPDPAFLARAIDKLRARLDDGRIRPGDQLILLDVGLHAEDPAAHRDQWLQLRRAAVADHDVHLLICTGFDGFPARNRKTHLSGIPWARFAYDEAFNGAIAEAAEAPGEFRGRTTLVPLQPAMREFDARAAELGASAFQRDGIHLNLWGQLFLSATLCRAAAPGRPLDGAAVAALVAAAWPQINTDAPPPDLASALALVEAALAPPAG